MGDDTYPKAIRALSVMETILRTCQGAQMTLPHLELSWWEGTPDVEVHWYPTLNDTEEPIGPLVADLTEAFVAEGQTPFENTAAFSYTDEMHGIPVRFSIHK